MALYPTVLNSANIDPTPTNTATLTQVTVTTTAIQLLAANSNRKGFTIFNTKPGKNIYVGFANTVTNALYFVLIPGLSMYEWGSGSPYTGALYAIGDTTNMLINVAEFTP